MGSALDKGPHNQKAAHQKGRVEAVKQPKPIEQAGQ